MASRTIPLGPEDRVTALYSYPNQPDSPETLSQTVLHWTGQSLERDGLAARGATADVAVEGDAYSLVLDGPDDLADAFARYAERLPAFLENGWNALQVVQTLRTMKKDPPWPDWAKGSTPDERWDPTAVWDPQGTGEWYFFLPLGMAMIAQRSVQFFHYPPVRLLNTMRDYLDDPVPVRWVELLEANGVETEQEAWLHSRVIDGAPIAAPDDQGTIYPPHGQSGDTVHLMPIEHFHDYQRAQLELLLSPAGADSAYTVPLVVYGTPARDAFNELYGVDLDVESNPTITHEIVAGKKTPIACVGHPYRFYAEAQSEVGSGSIVPDKCAEAVEIMEQDLVVARWQYLMGEDPTQDPARVLEDCGAYWKDPARAGQVCALVRHEGTLWYPDPASLEFKFKLTLDQANGICRENDDQPCKGLG